MKKNRWILKGIILMISITLLTNEIRAEEVEKTQSWGNLYLNVFEIGTIIFPSDGSDVIPLSTATLLEVNPIFNINNDLMWSIVAGVGTPNVVFNPAPYCNTGPVFLLTDRLALNPFLLYQWNPSYDINGGVNSHLLGIGVLLAVTINDTISLLFPVSTAMTLGGGYTGDGSFGTGIGFGVKL